MTSLEQLQLDFKGMIENDSTFTNIGVYSLRSAKTQSEIDAILAGTKKKNGKAGVAVVVYIPELVNDQPDPAGPFPNVRVTLAVIEIPVINEGAIGTNQSADALALYIHKLRFRIVRSGAVYDLTPSQNALRAQVDSVTIGNQETTRLVYFLEFDGELDVTELPRVAPVSITESEGMITLSCATAGASIYYTTNDSFPGPGATLYSAPFSEPAAGTLIRAAAFKSGTAPSPITEATIV